MSTNKGRFEPKQGPKLNWSLFSRGSNTDKSPRKSILPSGQASVSQPSLPSSRPSGLLGFRRRKSVERLEEVGEDVETPAIGMKQGSFFWRKSNANASPVAGTPGEERRKLNAAIVEPIRAYALSNFEVEMCEGRQPRPGYGPLKANPTEPGLSAGVETETESSAAERPGRPAMSLHLRRRPGQARLRTLEEVQCENLGSRFSTDTETSSEAGSVVAPLGSAPAATSSGLSSPTITNAQSTPNLSSAPRGLPSATVPKSASTNTMARRDNTTTSFLDSPTSSEASSPRQQATAADPRLAPTALSLSNPHVVRYFAGQEEGRFVPGAPHAAPFALLAEQDDFAQVVVAGQRARARRGADGS